MKNPIVFFIEFFNRRIILVCVVFMYFIFSACEKKEEEYVNESILTIHTNDNVAFQDVQRCFVLIENSNSIPVFKELSNSSDYEFFRNDSIKSDVFNIHVIDLQVYEGESTFSIESYSSIPVGKHLVLGVVYGPSPQVSSSSVHYKFIDIPDFDVVSRTAQFQRHSHTVGSLEDVRCEPTEEWQTFPVGEMFYACFQKGEDAGFILQEITDTDPNVISFDSLNYNMVHYELPKKVGNADLTYMSIRVLDANYGFIRIFYLQPSEIPIFSSGKVDLFVPGEGLDIVEYSTSFGYSENSNHYNNYYLDENVITSTSFINAEVNGLVINRQLNFSTSGEFDYVSVGLSIPDCRWSFYGTDSKDLYIPEFPEELAAIIGEPDFSELKTVSVSLYDFSEYNGNNELVDLVLEGFLTSKEVSLNENYKSLTKSFTFQNTIVTP